jgi:hypothetical protein
MSMACHDLVIGWAGHVLGSPLARLMGPPWAGPAMFCTWPGHGGGMAMF